MLLDSTIMELGCMTPTMDSAIPLFKDASSLGISATLVISRSRRSNATPTFSMCRKVIIDQLAVVLSIGFTGYAYALWRDYSDALARKTFRFSLIHLSLLFAALLVDHYL